MTKEQIEAIRARCEAATPGPWKVERYYNEEPGYEEFIKSAAIIASDGEFARTITRNNWSNPVEADLNFISHARTDIPSLFAEVERLQEAQPIKCSECTYYYKGCCSHGINDLTERKPDDYCSYGERKG